MAVPDTNTFNLQDVTDEISGTQTSLSACFADANASAFDPAHEGSKNSLLNFRNYDESTTGTVTVSPTSERIPAGAGSHIITVTVTGSTPWSAFSNDPWITLTGSTSGTSSGTFTLNYSTNPTSEFRTGSIRIEWAGPTLQSTVLQSFNT